MEKVINKRASELFSIVLLMYFTGIALYSLLPELQVTYNLFPSINYDSKWWDVFYWVNNLLVGGPSFYVFSYFIINRLTKLIIRGASFFLLTLGIFQIINTIGVDVGTVLWIIFCPTYIIFLLIAFKYGRKIR